MTNEALVRETVDHPSEASRTSEAPAKVTTLEAVVNFVREDSRQDPQDYLDESTVPFGGE